MKKLEEKYLGSKVNVQIDKSFAPEEGFVIGVDEGQDLMLVAMSEQGSSSLMNFVRFTDLTFGTSMLANINCLETQLERATEEFILFGEGSIDIEDFKCEGMVFVWVDESMVEVEKSHMELLVETFVNLMGGLEDEI